MVALAGLTVGALGFTVAPAEASTASSIDSYVALGDSYTSGPLIPTPTGKLGCGRSDSNYPHLVAEALDVEEFSDASCAGATTESMTEPQDIAFGANAPQFKRLESDTDLVTLGIGGNDIGFADIVLTCAKLDFYRPHGNACEEHYTSGGEDELVQRIEETASEVGAVLEGIQERSPRARVLVIGYPDILPEHTRGCWPEVPFSSGDVPYLRSIEKKLNDMLAEQAAAGGATYVDTYASSIGHDVCKPDAVKWVEAFLPTDFAFPVHPNADGMDNDAEQVLDALGA